MGDMGDLNWPVIVGVLTGITGFLSAIFSWIRNKKTDTLSLYSSFVDDLHSEVTRLRDQYADDRKSWAEEKQAMTETVETLKAEVGRLKQQIAIGAPISLKTHELMEELVRELEGDQLKVKTKPSEQKSPRVRKQS